LKVWWEVVEIIKLFHIKLKGMERSEGAPSPSLCSDGVTAYNTRKRVAFSTQKELTETPGLHI